MYFPEILKGLKYYKDYQIAKGVIIIFKRSITHIRALEVILQKVIIFLKTIAFLHK